MVLGKGRKDPLKSKWILLSVILASGVLDVVDAQARLMFPIGRSSRWREQWDAPENFEDHLVNCGGMYMDYFEVDLMCGVCGDNLTVIDGAHMYMINQSYPNEAGGMYATSRISATFNVSDELVAIVEIMASRKGYIEFHVCPNNNFSAPATVECMNDHPLLPLNGTVVGYKWYVPETDNTAHGYYHIPLQLPEGLKCAQCVFRMRWRTGSNWGEEGNNYGLGYGAQEYFFACSDIQIGEGFTEEELRRMYTVNPDRQGYKRDPYKAHKEKTSLGSGTHVYDKTSRNTSTSYSRIEGATTIVTGQPQPGNQGVETQTQGYDKDKNVYTPTAGVLRTNQQQQTDKPSPSATARLIPRITVLSGVVSTQPNGPPIRSAPTTEPGGSGRPTQKVQKKTSTDAVTKRYDKDQNVYSPTSGVSEANKIPITDKVDSLIPAARSKMGTAAASTTETDSVKDEMTTPKQQTGGKSTGVVLGSSVKYEKGNGDYTQTSSPPQLGTDNSGATSVKKSIGDGATEVNKITLESTRPPTASVEKTQPLPDRKPSEYDQDKNVYVPTAGLDRSSNVSGATTSSSSPATDKRVTDPSGSGRRSQTDVTYMTPPSSGMHTKGVVTGYNKEQSAYRPTDAPSVTKQQRPGTILPLETGPTRPWVITNTAVGTSDQRSASESVTVFAQNGERSTGDRKVQEQKEINTHATSGVVGEENAPSGRTVYPRQGEESYKTTAPGQTEASSKKLFPGTSQGITKTDDPSHTTGAPPNFKITTKSPMSRTEKNPIPTKSDGTTPFESVKVEMTTVRPLEMPTTGKSSIGPKSEGSPSAGTSTSVGQSNISGPKAPASAQVTPSSENTYASHGYNKSKAVYGRISTNGIDGVDKITESSKASSEKGKGQTGSGPSVTGSNQVQGVTQIVSQGKVDATTQSLSSTVGGTPKVATRSYQNGEGNTKYHTNGGVDKTKELYTGRKTLVSTNTKPQTTRSGHSTMSPSGSSAGQTVGRGNVQNMYTGASTGMKSDSTQSNANTPGGQQGIHPTMSKTTAGAGNGMTVASTNTQGTAMGSVTSTPSPTADIFSLPPPPQTKFIIPFSTRMVTTRMVVTKSKSPGTEYNRNLGGSTKPYTPPVGSNTPEEYHGNKTSTVLVKASPEAGNKGRTGGPPETGKQRKLHTVEASRGGSGVVGRILEPAETLDPSTTLSVQTNNEQTPGSGDTPPAQYQGGMTERVATGLVTYSPKQRTDINRKPTRLPKIVEQGPTDIPPPDVTDVSQRGGQQSKMTKDYNKQQGNTPYTEQKTGVTYSTNDGTMSTSPPAPVSLQNLSTSRPKYQTIYPVPAGAPTTAPPQFGRVYGTTFRGQKTVIIPGYTTGSPRTSQGQNQGQATIDRSRIKASTTLTAILSLQGETTVSSHGHEGTSDYGKESGSTYDVNKTTPLAINSGQSSANSISQATNTPQKSEQTGGSVGQGGASSGSDAISGQTTATTDPQAMRQSSITTRESNQGVVNTVPQQGSVKTSQNKTVYALNGDGKNSSYDRETSTSPDTITSVDSAVDSKQGILVTRTITQEIGSRVPGQEQISTVSNQGQATTTGSKRTSVQIQLSKAPEGGAQNLGPVTVRSTPVPEQVTESTISVETSGLGQTTGPDQSTASVQEIIPAVQGQASTATTGSLQTGEVSNSPSLRENNRRQSPPPGRGEQTARTTSQRSSDPLTTSSSRQTTPTSRPGTPTPPTTRQAGPSLFDVTSSSRKFDRVVTYKPTGYETLAQSGEPGDSVVTYKPNYTPDKPSTKKRLGAVTVAGPKLTPQNKPYPASGEVSIIEALNECNAINVYLPIKGSRRWCINNCSKGFCPEFLCNEWCVAMKISYSTKYRRKP
ncbi:mucin-2-like [Liolophura sinensis]|uniref:mucin-2-like n=1 Tax=Liolophura sinensis TaxID=3198878 RepID=UPI0031597311